MSFLKIQSGKVIPQAAAFEFDVPTNKGNHQLAFESGSGTDGTATAGTYAVTGIPAGQKKAIVVKNAAGNAVTFAAATNVIAPFVGYYSKIIVTPTGANGTAIASLCSI